MKMSAFERVTVTLPNDLVQEIDRLEKNRSRFVAEAVRREVNRRQRAELRRSLRNPHQESALLADQGFDEWARSLPEEDADELVHRRGGRPVRWTPGKGWVAGRQ
jgi:hypothetical protein